jgi:hypothetical protein
LQVLMLCCWTTERADSSYVTRRVRVLDGSRSQEEDKTKSTMEMVMQASRTAREIRDRAHTVELPRQLDGFLVLQSEFEGIGSLGGKSFIQFKSDAPPK